MQRFKSQFICSDPDNKEQNIQFPASKLVKINNEKNINVPINQTYNIISRRLIAVSSLLQKTAVENRKKRNLNYISSLFPLKTLSLEVYHDLDNNKKL